MLEEGRNKSKQLVGNAGGRQGSPAEGQEDRACWGQYLLGKMDAVSLTGPGAA